MEWNGGGRATVGPGSESGSSSSHRARARDAGLLLKPSLTEKGPNGGGAAFHRNELGGQPKPSRSEGLVTFALARLHAEQ